MSRIFLALAALGTVALLSFAAPANAAPRVSGVSNVEQVNLSARRYYRRHYHARRFYVRRHYRPYRHYYWAPRYYRYRPYYGYRPYYYPYYRPYYYRPYYYRPYPFFPFAPWW